MRVVKTYENFITKEVSDEFDLEFAMAKIKHFFSEYDVKNMVDDEIENWVDDSNLTEINRNNQEYETKREWYDEHCAGEAEEVVSEQIVDWFENKFDRDLSEENRNLLIKSLIHNYDSLKH